MGSIVKGTCPKHGESDHFPPNARGKSFCMDCYDEATEACDCLFDQVPLRGPDPDCTTCGGSGVPIVPGTGGDFATRLMKAHKAWDDGRHAPPIDPRCTLGKPLLMVIPHGGTTISCPVHPEGHHVRGPEFTL